MRSPESPFERYMSERIFSFAYLMCPSVSGRKATCHSSFNFREKLQNIFEIGLKTYGSVRTKIALIEKVFLKKKFADTVLFFMCYSTHCQNLGQSDKFPMTFSFLQCPLNK